MTEKMEITSVVQEVEKSFITLLHGALNGTAHSGTTGQFCKMSSCDPVSPHIGMYPREMKACIHAKTATLVFLAAFYITA
jgi:hypothetical protein